MHQNYLWDQWRNRSSRNLLLESWIFLMFFFSDPTMANHHFPPPFGRRCLFMLVVQPPFSTHTISKESKVQTLSCHLLAAVTRVIRYLYPKAAPPRGHLHQLPLHHLFQVPVPPVPPLPRAEGSPKCTPHDLFLAERWRASPKHPKPKPSPCPPVALPMQSIRAPAGKIPRVSRDGIALKWTVQCPKPISQKLGFCGENLGSWKSGKYLCNYHCMGMFWVFFQQRMVIHPDFFLKILRHDCHEVFFCFKGVLNVAKNFRCLRKSSSWERWKLQLSWWEAPVPKHAQRARVRRAQMGHMWPAALWGVRKVRRNPSICRQRKSTSAQLKAVRLLQIQKLIVR